MEVFNEIVRTATGHRVHVEHHVSGHDRETVVLVNGALSTTTSFRGTVKYLRPHFDVVLYDLPCYGASRAHNEGCGELCNDEEVAILRTLIDRYEVNHVASISWGGLAALQVLATRPPSVKTAAIGSFSPLLNDRMLDYVSSAEAHIEAGDPDAAASLLNDTVGRFLPRLLKAHNHRYVRELLHTQHRQVLFHIRQMRTLPVGDYLRMMRRIEVPVLFLNGELDEYTTASDIRTLAHWIDEASFQTIPGAGHFLDLESKQSWERVRDAVVSFMRGAPVILEEDDAPHPLPAREAFC